MNRYYMADGMVQRGPFEVADLPGQGLRADTLVWKEGMDQWRRADEVEELIFAGVLGQVRPEVGPTTPPQLPPAPSASLPYANPVPVGMAYNPASASTNRIVAGICGIALGGLGIHKFVLGMVGPCIAMLLISLVGVFFTCGIASMFISVICIIEGIIYLTRTDEQFFAEYVVRKKGWF